MKIQDLLDTATGGYFQPVNEPSDAWRSGAAGRLLRGAAR